jgi:hypothetical protein
MALRIRSMLVTLAISSVVGLGPAVAADRSDVDAAAAGGARRPQMGRGRMLEGAGETARGIGNTIVEGARYTGEKLGEAGKAAGPAARTAWDRTKEGAVAFGSSVREFFGTLFQ